MRSRTRAGGWLVGLTALLAAVVLGSAAVGPVRIAPAAVVAATANALAVPASMGFAVERVAVAGTTVPIPAARVGFAAPFRFPVPARHAFIVTRIRLPRIVLAAVVGFALASAGAVMQGFFRNPMADPSIVGVSSGAAVGAVAVIVAPLSLPFGVPGAAFVGALLAAFAVYLIATQGGRTPVATLLLSGLAVQSLLGAVVSFLIVGSDDRGLREAVFWLMGSLRNSGWDEVALTLPVALACFAVLAAHARDLNVMLLGETDAVTLGVELERTKRVLLAVASVITGAAVAFVGVVGFVGLVVPHVMRLLVGPDHRLLLPASALAGGAFLVAADTVARSALGGAELPVGVVTAFVGAPFFLYLLRSREVHSL